MALIKKAWSALVSGNSKQIVLAAARAGTDAAFF